ncbi:MAG TPA: hypothetical protein VJC37_08660 [Planctomycetota bacterium]|nr:hypothetical protein [Planctomycetota bacterium]
MPKPPGKNTSIGSRNMPTFGASKYWLIACGVKRSPDYFGDDQPYTSSGQAGQDGIAGQPACRQAGMMQGLNVSYTRYINKRYERTGRLLEGRYHSCIIDEEPYLWAVARYIEQNPLRAGMVKAPEEYPYSSARAHITGEPNEVLSDELITEDGRPDYIEFVKAPSPKREIERIRITTKRGMPLGGDIFVERLERRLKRRFGKKKSGRPRK